MTQGLLAARSPTISTHQVVELRNVSMRFGDKQVLDDVSLVVASRKFGMRLCQTLKDWI